ncbi:MAG: hypothetical protein CBD51_002730 [Flavobacteriales bacterium TMED191]|nr:MAG: hypothetical protein CBD51_002730 [Flavobacteriales bacterium TMED191]
MTNSDKNPILTFNEKKYDINSLPDKAKDLIKAAQVAETQIKMQEDNLKLISVARQTISSQLKNELENVTPIE